ncbi:unnamed protein product, partial [Didymodactylos carnosus]
MVHRCTTSTSDIMNANAKIVETLYSAVLKIKTTLGTMDLDATTESLQHQQSEIRGNRITTVILSSGKKFMWRRNSSLSKKKDKKIEHLRQGLKIQKSVIKDEQKIADELANFYEEHFSAPQPNLNNPVHVECLEAFERIKLTPNLPLAQIKFEEVQLQWKKFASKKSLDSVDNLAFLLQQLPPQYFCTITALFNKCVKQGEFFESGKIAKDDSTKLALIAKYLDGEASEWYLSNMDDLDTWSKFCIEIAKTYSSPAAKQLAAQQLQSRRQGLQESVMHYYNDILQLCETMDSQMTDQSKLIYLLQGLKLSLHKEVARQEPKTPLEFIQVAQKEERLDQSY